MSKIHALEGDGNLTYCVIHFAMPSGSNSAGKTWKAVGLASGYTGVTSRVVGTGPGQLTQAEYDSIIAGNTAEISGSTNADKTVDEINAWADSQIIAWQGQMASKLKWFGWVSAT